MALAAGTSIGPYKILSAIGAGGMGEVYRAKDTRLKRDVALKLLPEIFASDPGRLARFTREAEVLASLNHPNIASIYGVEDGALVMEFVDGEPPRGPMPFDQAWHIMSQIVNALEFAHDRGIVHRDLKPANVKVTADGVVKLLDFGLAKAFTEETHAPANQEHSPTLTLGATQLGVILGTAAYMAPEQAKGKSVDRRADIWAFGVMLYELLTGQPLFKGEDVSETLAQVLTKEPDLSRTPARAQKLLRRCLEKDPKKRLRDISEARYHIDEPVAPAPRRSMPALPWVIAGVMLLLAAVAYWLRPARENRVIRAFIPAPEQASYRCQGDDAGPAVLSPDGQRLAFSATGADGKVQLWVRPLDSVVAQTIPGANGAMFPFWSPNSRSLGFFADGKLKKIELASGTVSVLADAPSTRGGTWNRDDVIVFAPGLTSALMRVPASGGAATPVTRLDVKRHEISHRWPSFLPDGKQFLYTSRQQGIFAASLDGAEPPRRLLEESSNALYREGFLLYSHASVLLARPFDAGRREFTGSAITLIQTIQAEPGSDRACFTASDNGLLAYDAGLSESQLTWVDRRGNRTGTLGGPGLVQGVAVAPDGKRVAAVISDGSGGRSVWIYEAARGIRQRLISANTIYLGLAWSPDSNRVVTAVQRDGTYVLLSKEAGGSGGEELLFRSGFEISVSQWLANGGMALMIRDPKTGFDIFYLPPKGKGPERTPVPVIRGDASEIGGVVSPDGRWVLYGSDESAGGITEIYVAAFPSGSHRQQVSPSGVDVSAALWGPNGKEIFLVSHKKLMAAPVRPVGDALQTETPRLLFDLHADCILFEMSCFDVTPDGKGFLVLEPTGTPPPVALLQNWTAGLKK
jgi:Tol biopolymer transport system component